MDLFSEAIETKTPTAVVVRVPDVASDLCDAPDEDLSQLLAEQAKLVKMVNEFKFEELKSDLEIINAKINRLQAAIEEKKRENNREISSGDVVKYYFSDVLNQKLVWNRTKKIILVEDGVCYTEEEILATNSDAKGTKMIHEIKKSFNAEYKGYVKAIPNHIS